MFGGKPGGPWARHCSCLAKEHFSAEQRAGYRRPPIYDRLWGVSRLGGKECKRQCQESPRLRREAFRKALGSLIVNRLSLAPSGSQTNGHEEQGARQPQASFATCQALAAQLRSSAAQPRHSN